MKIDIENKILIPFMILLIISILMLGIVSYINGYHLLLKNEIENSSNNLEEMILFIENARHSINDQYEAKEFIVEYYTNLGKNNIIIFSDDNILLNTYNDDNSWIRSLMNEKLNYNNKSISTSDYIFTYQIYSDWNWVIGYRLNKDIFFYEVLESQKYMILIAIVSLIFSMQAAILISYNISKPIKMLAELCDRIVDQGSFQEKIGIKRKDEIGILAKAFNNMLDRLQYNTNELIEVTKFNEDILKNIPAGIITTDQYGNMMSINQAAEDFLSTERLIDRDIRENLQKQLYDTLDKNKKINNVLVFNDIQEGNKIYLDVTTSILKVSEGSKSGAICNFSDISERKKIENNMDTLDRLTSIGQLAAGIAHEIRNPLAGMKTGIQVLKNRLCKLEDKSNEKLFDGILHEINRINHLITSLLDFAKPRAPEYEKTDLVEVLDRALELVNKTALENNIKINVDINCKNTMAFVDKAQLEQIFLNIIKNAVTAINIDGVLNIIFNNYFGENGYIVEIEFQDTGCGIQPQDFNKIFNPFFTTRPQGAGLGLSVVYELVKSNQGEINIQSIVNEGTNVKLRFPTNGGERNEQ
nr:ATP-binding protein [Sedimentibacter sp.]